MQERMIKRMTPKKRKKQSINELRKNWLSESREEACFRYAEHEVFSRRQTPLKREKPSGRFRPCSAGQMCGRDDHNPSRCPIGGTTIMKISRLIDSITWQLIFQKTRDLSSPFCSPSSQWRCRRRWSLVLTSVWETRLRVNGSLGSKISTSYISI